MNCFFSNESPFFVHLSDFFFPQGEFDGVLREEVVAEKLYQLGRSGSGTEQVYLSLNLSVSMTRSHLWPWAGCILTLVGPDPFSPVLTAFLVAANLTVLHLVENSDKSFLCLISAPTPTNSFVFISFTV